MKTPPFPHGQHGQGTIEWIILKKAVTVRPEQESPHMVTTVTG